MIPALCLSLVFWFSTFSHWTIIFIGGSLSPSQSPPSASGVTESPAPVSPSAKPAETAAAPDLLGEARELLRKGDFDHAIEKYQQALKEKPNSPEAYAGLARGYLKKKDVQKAFDTATKGVHVADSSALRVVLGEVYFREGRFREAEQEWARVIVSDHPEARAFLGMARVRWATSMNRSGDAMLERAHQLDPNDSEITELWVETLNRAERIKYLEKYLAGPTNDDAETRKDMQHYLDYLKARASDPRGGCHLVGNAVSTETGLIPLHDDRQQLRAFGLPVAVNGKKSQLLLDTGASGILITHGLAEKAGVTKLADTQFGGVGDKGDRNGYIGLADSLKIGDLEFQNCPVEVVMQRSVVGDEGLVGTDVFADFLIELDFPNQKLRLSDLPKRPGAGARRITLQTESGNAGSGAAEPAAGSKSAETASSPPSGPEDAYIAPEMQADYTKVYRFGHDLLVPTYIDAAPVKLFLLDSGANVNFISAPAAREVTKIHGDPDSYVKGVRGSVEKVYRADRASILFGHLRQENENLVAIDLTHLSDGIGTEVSGMLGFRMLRLLNIKIDYRDGLVDFTY